MVFETNDLDGLTADELTELNGQLHALKCAVRRVRLDVIKQIDDELWRGDGARSMGEWLTGPVGTPDTGSCRLGDTPTTPRSNSTGPAASHSRGRPPSLQPDTTKAFNQRFNNRGVLRSP